VFEVGRRAYGVLHQAAPVPCPPQLTAAEVRRLEHAEEGRAALLDSLDGLKQRVANME
jgi:hypothetical protein